MKKFCFLIIFSSLSGLVMAQGFSRPLEWKKYRRELFVSTGTSNFLGDLGGGNGKGRDYSPRDLDFNQTRTAFGVGGRYKLQRTLNVVAKFSYLLVKGDDAQTKDIYRNNRNLNFKSNVFELTGRIEYGYQRTKRGGGHYGVQKNYARYKNFSHSIYGFVGLGVFYFDPKGRDANGDWVKLRPLHTEGQGLIGGPKQYKRVSVSIPIGGYYKLTLSKVWSFGIELCYRKTFTDYMDDVGYRYYNKADLLANYGPKTVEMADPSLGLIYGATSPAADGTPAQRGDKQKDTFISLEITAGYTFKKQRKSARLRSKF